MRILPQHLAPRLVLALTFLVAVIEIVFAVVNVRTQRRQLLDGMIRGTDQLSRSITSATWHAMLADRRQDVYLTLATIAREPGIRSIRIFNKEGRITYSTNPGDPKVVDKNAEACFLCHSREQPHVRLDVTSRARIYRGRDGGRRMGMVTPIYNEPSCSTAACHAHPESKSVLGVLDISMDLATVDSEVVKLEFGAIATTLTQVILLAVLIVLLTRRLVGEPIRKMTAATRAMQADALGEPLDVQTPAELRLLAQSFNEMRERLRVALDDLNQLAHDLERRVEERSRQLSAARDKLVSSARLASLGQLSASVAHEINNPISGVLNLSMLLQRILREDGIPPGRVAEFKRYLSQISEESARVGRIVKDLLAFARVPNSRRTEVNLNALVRKTMPLVEHKLAVANVRTELELSPDVPTLVCDGSQVQQVLINLVMNATEAMHGGGVVRVCTRLDHEAQRAELAVADSGAGIPHEQLPRIFDPFFTTKEEGKGVGLGLWVVYGIVENHGGTIDVHSEIGKGTTFVVRLPLQPPETDEEAHAPPGATAIAPPSITAGEPATPQLPEDSR
jgi:two-component system NtrC family sensor kinase